MGARSKQPRRLWQVGVPGDSRPLGCQVYSSGSAERRYIMPQDRESGRKAAIFGHEMAKKVAAHLRTELLPGPSNNAVWNGKKVNIKSAKLRNTKIGATLNNLAWADSIIAAIQEDETGFALYEVTSD